jgi:LmbE family N-acetylglucosaminyl deacetylase
MRRAVLLLALVACGDNELPDAEPLPIAPELVIVAHQDDDLLFMQPDVLEAVQRGNGVVNVYVTAGNNTKGADYADDRYSGLMSAYAQVTAQHDWFCGWLSIDGHFVEHCRLHGANLSLVFLAYPDGGLDQILPNALLRLWEGTITGADTVAHRVSHYDQSGLIETLGAIIADVQPRTIRTLEIAATHGRDHEDHMIAGALTVLAAAQVGSDADILSYRGYNIESEPANTLEPVFQRSATIVEYYDACATGCASCGGACSSIEDAHVTWLHRRYAVAIRRHASGTLELGGQCAKADSSGSIGMVDCAGAPIWTFTPDHHVQIDTRCLQILFTGELVAGPCGFGATQRFFLDDEGHIFTGVPPTPADNMDNAHLDCLVVDGGRPHGALCGDQHATPGIWQVTRPTRTTTRASLGLIGSGRAVRLGDLTHDGKADLCEVRPTGLFCAPGKGDGTFAPSVRITALPIDPTSLTIGDVDGDGLPDACGRIGTGMLCATARTGFTTRDFTTELADVLPASLGTVDEQICGLAPAGVTCVTGASSHVISTWPPADSPLWPADLDADGAADWCTATPAGPACARAVDITSDGAPWGFASMGVVENATGLDAGTAALADVDGDGRADLCVLDGTRIACAFAQDTKFGPRATVATIPPATSLWLGDLDGDGRADFCTSDATTISCAFAP